MLIHLLGLLVIGGESCPRASEPRVGFFFLEGKYSHELYGLLGSVISGSAAERLGSEGEFNSYTL